jgi:superfamily II DNA or RNA helicase
MGTYFRDNYLSVRYPIAEAGHPGLRRAQLGAIHAIATHFTRSTEPGVIVMPTGSGKTAVLMMAAYNERAARVLIVTPSVLVRNQIAEDFQTLGTLKQLNVLPAEAATPRVHEVVGKLRTEADWRNLERFDVIVATPFSVSPAAPGVSAPPPEMFDFIAVDEAHHSRAPTWNALLTAFPTAKQVHFTATPFRHDRQALSGEFIYTYSLNEANAEGVFGAIRYIPVEPEGENADVAIATATERVFRDDRDAGLKHLIMVRTDSRERANALREVYAKNTGLNLRLVHSGLSPKTVKRTIEDLRNAELDGVICVDMLGEGFDLPTLKIAAVHAPHRSLSVTLQFIGRFARTAARDRIGEAKFVAVPSEIEIEREKLFEESAAWQQMVANLSEGRIAQEIEIRRQIATFKPAMEEVEPDYRDIPLHALWPFNHFKVYRVTRPVEEIDIEAEVVLPPPFEVVSRLPSKDLHAAVFFTRSVTHPRWTDARAFATTEHDLFVVYHDRDTNMLFIHSSRRSDSLYELVADCFTAGAHRILPLSRVNSVLATLNDLEFYNIGMRRRALHPNAESYRIGAGAAMQNAVSHADGAMYHRGHVFGAGVGADGVREIIGYSSASKVWSNRQTLIPQLIGWAQMLAWRIHNFRDVITGSGLDLLDLGQELDALPDEGILAVDWPLDVYSSPRRITDLDNGQQVPLLDLDLDVDFDATKGGVVRVTLSGDELSLGVDYSLTANGSHFDPAGWQADRYIVNVGREDIPLPEYLRHNPPRLFLSDFSSISDGQLFRAPDELTPFDTDRIEVLAWADLGVNISKEFEAPADRRIGTSIHDYLLDYLPKLADEVVFYDHGSGEMADFVTFSRTDGGVMIRFYHCKGSTGAKPGSRVADTYDVASQVVKSVIWLRGAAKILARVNERERSRKGSQFVKGDRALLKEVLETSRTIGLRYEMVLVQPGISKEGVENNIATVLAAADRFIVDHQCENLRVWASS